MDIYTSYLLPFPIFDKRLNVGTYISHTNKPPRVSNVGNVCITRAIPDFWLIDFEIFFFSMIMMMYVQVYRSEFSAFGIFVC